jgi:hypothetical protein
MKTNLVLHCGARSITRDELFAVKAPTPTDTWCPVPYSRLVTEVERSLAASNMRVVGEAYGVTDENKRMFGLLQVANCQPTTDYAYVVGLRGSIDKSLAEGVAVGSSVFVCDNLAFSSEIVFHRKNTTNVLTDLPTLVDTAIGQLSARWNDQNVRFDTYKNKGLNEEDALLLTYRAYKADVFPWAKGADVLSEFVKPRHAEFLANGHTLWTFFNAVTENLKPRSENSKASGLWSMPARTGRLHKICDDFAGLQLTAPASN